MPCAFMINKDFCISFKCQRLSQAHKGHCTDPGSGWLGLVRPQVPAATAASAFPLCHRGLSHRLRQQAGPHAGGAAADEGMGHTVATSHHELVTPQER